MADKITRCPQCFTSFRISDTHLNSAKGAVRCGSCLYIFSAKEYLISNVADEPTMAEGHLKTGNQNTISAPATEEQDDLLINDAMETSDQEEPVVNEEFNDVIFGKGDTTEHDFNLFEREAEQEDDQEVTPEDESWALDLLENDDEEPVTAPTAEQEIIEEERSITEEFEASYYKNSFQIIDEQQEDDKTHVADSSTAQPSQIDRDVFTEYDQAEEEEYDYSDSSQFDKPLSTNNKYLESIEPEPVEFNWQRHSTFWQSKLLWGGLSSMAIALLVIQVAWIKFDSLSMVKPYRNYYATICHVFSCTLPDLIDRSKIRTANLVVRSHPNNKNALVVDAVLQNTAKFEQTFPVLDLVFTDRQDKTVAARRLVPHDYLSGELFGRTHMPVKQPIHIAIEIADPGNEAIGYKISIAD